MTVSAAFDKLFCFHRLFLCFICSDDSGASIEIGSCSVLPQAVAPLAKPQVRTRIMAEEADQRMPLKTDIDEFQKREEDDCARCVDSLDGYESEHYVSTNPPLFEPPIFDYHNFIENVLPYNARFKKLLPNETTKWVKCRDLKTEGFLLRDYGFWATDLSQFDKDPKRRAFYDNSFADFGRDWKETAKEGLEAFTGVTALGQWEFNNLDQEGGTEKIEGWSETELQTQCYVKDAWEKYRYLAPSGFEPDRFWDREFGRWVNVDGSPIKWGNPNVIEEESSTANSVPIGKLSKGSDRSSNSNLPINSKEHHQTQLQPPPSPIEEDQCPNLDFHPWFNAL